jgi:hypothetical protein
MILLSLLAQASTEAPPVNLIGPYLVSSAGMLTGGAALWKAAFNAGRFQEFKEQMEKKYESRENFETTVVRQHEFQRLSDHIDRRFDEVSHQLAEIRRLRQES